MATCFKWMIRLFKSFCDGFINQFEEVAFPLFVDIHYLRLFRHLINDRLLCQDFSRNLFDDFINDFIRMFFNDSVRLLHDFATHIIINVVVI
nr:MAG TPA: hypothetical protein [Caudoviricetes sp.]